MTDPRDIEVAQRLGWYTQTDAMAVATDLCTPAGDLHALWVPGDSESAWDCVPTYHRHMDACQEILERVRSADHSWRTLFLCVLRLQPSLAGVPPEETVLHLSAEVIVDAFLYAARLRMPPVWRADDIPVSDTSSP